MPCAPISPPLWSQSNPIAKFQPSASKVCDLGERRAADVRCTSWRPACTSCRHRSRRCSCTPRTCRVRRRKRGFPRRSYRPRGTRRRRSGRRCSRGCPRRTGRRSNIQPSGTRSPGREAGSPGSPRSPRTPCTRPSERCSKACPRRGSALEPALDAAVESGAAQLACRPRSCRPPDSARTRHGRRSTGCRRPHWVESAHVALHAPLVPSHTWPGSVQSALDEHSTQRPASQ